MLRLAMAVPQVLLVVTLAFFVIRALPGSPARAAVGGGGVTQELIDLVNAKYGLDEPVVEQYWIYLKHLVQGDLGVSFLSQQTVASEIFSVLPSTLLLAGVAVVVGWPAGVAVGSWAARRPLQVGDRITTFLTTLAIATPTYFIALLLLFQVGLEVPALGAGKGGIGGLVLPVTTLSILVIGLVARVTRNSLLEARHAEHVTVARAKGVAENLVWKRHVRRNGLVPVVTLAGLTIGDLLAGAVFVETVFLREGLGQLVVTSVVRKDFPVVQGVILVVALLYALINLLIDFLYAYLDPQYRDALGRT